MSTICRPCIALVPDPPCPSDFSGGTVTPPIPTRQRVCNTEQTASCPDGSNPEIVEAGTFCTVVLNPTASSVATTQAALDAQALAQAQSEVGDCAWEAIVWTIDPNINAGGGGNPNLISSSGSGLAGNAQVQVFAPIVAPADASSRGCKATGDITFSYKTGTVTHHNISGTFINASAPAGTPFGVFSCSIEIFEGQDFAHLGSIYASSHSGVGALGTFPYSHDFTSDGHTPKVYRIVLQTSTYSEQTYNHTQSATVSIKALD